VEVLERLSRLIEVEVIRRFSATIGHRALGIVANAMIVWRVPPEDVERVGGIMASFDEVTHCYERPSVPDWPYNLYTVVHSPSRDECRRVAAEISSKTGVEDYQVLFSEREFKKTGARI
jgi:DNA-binding Lrp family transcriptional regulator